MPADVIINPNSGEIYWNDGTGTPQSISIRGDSQNKIDIIGYSASFSPGGSGVGTFVIATFSDNSGGLVAFAPGSTGNELGSSTLRWKPYLTTTTISDSSSTLGTNTSSLLTGLVQINGGIAISGSASIGGTILFFNRTNSIFYAGLRASSSLASTTIYTLPLNYPGTGTSVLRSDTSGNLDWAPLSATTAGSATTAQNVQVTLVGNSNTFHSVLLTPTISSAGSAVSANGTLTYNTQSDILSTPGLAVTSGANSTSTTSGALQVRGGVGITGNAFIGGTINVASPLTIPNGGTNASSFGQSAGFVYYDGVNVRLLAATGASINFTNGYYQFDNRVYATSFFGGGNQMPNGSGTAGRLTFWSGNNTIAADAELLYDNTNNILTSLGNINGIGFTASGVAVTSPLNATSTSSGALTVTGGLALGGNAFIGGTVNITNTTQSAYGSSTSGAVVVAGSVGIGGSVYIGGQLGVGGTLDYLATGNVAYFSGNSNSYTQVVVHNHNSGNSASSDFIVSNDSATDTTFFGDFGMNSSGWAATTAAYNTANAVYLVSNSGDLAIGSLTSNAVRFFFNNGAVDSVAMGGAGMTIFYGTTASSTTSGALQVRGGLGITGNAFIGGSTHLTGIEWVNNSTNATSTATGALIVSGGLALGSNAFIGGTIYSTSTGWFNNVTASTSPTTGTLIVGGGVGVGQSVAIGGRLLLFNGATNYTGFVSAASGVTTYTLPPSTPAGTAVSVLQSTHEGVMSWVPMVAGSSSGLATTSQSVQVNLVGNANVFHSLLLTPTISSAGSAVSGNGTLTYNTSSDILSTPGLAVTSGANSTSTTSGALQVRGGVGITGNAFIGGTINVSSPLTIPNGGTNASSFGQSAGFIYYDGVNVRLLAATGATINFTNGYYQFDNRVYATSFFGGGVQMPNGTGTAGRLTFWSGNNTIAADAELLYDNTNNILTSLGNINGIGFTASGVAVTSAINATSTTSGALTVTGGFALAGNAFIGGSTHLTGIEWINNATTSISTSTGALIVNGGVGIGGSLYLTTSVPSNISGIFVLNGVLSGSALTATSSLTATNIRTTASTLNIVDSGTSNTVLNYNGSRFGVLIDANSTASNNGGLVVTGGAGFGASINVNGNISARSGFELRIYNPADNAYTGFDFTGSGSTTYILPPSSPATGSSVLQSTAGGVMSWVPMATGSGSPGGSDSQLQFNNSASFGGAVGLTYQPTLYLTSIASTADHRAVTTVGLRLINHSTVSIAGVQQRYSPALELVGKTIQAPSTEFFNRFTTDVFGAVSSYAAQQQWKYSYDTGTASYSNPLFIIHSHKGIGIGQSSITFQSFFRANASQASELLYVLPVAYPGTGTSVLSSDTTGNLSWVPMTTGGSGTPGGSTRQIQYNNGGVFGGASGFEYQTVGNAVTVNIFATAGGGLTSGLSINTINGTTTRIGIGLTNPAFELEIRGEISATNKSFVIDHPTKPDMKLRYGSLEGPENGVYVRGQLFGTNVIETPDYWRGLVHDDSYTIHLTPIGNYQQLYIDKIQDYKVYVGTASTFEINCFYSVWAERKDISKLIVEY